MGSVYRGDLRERRREILTSGLYIAGYSLLFIVGVYAFSFEAWGVLAGLLACGGAIFFIARELDVHAKKMEKYEKNKEKQ